MDKLGTKFFSVLSPSLRFLKFLFLTLTRSLSEKEKEGKGDIDRGGVGGGLIISFNIIPH